VYIISVGCKMCIPPRAIKNKMQSMPVPPLLWYDGHDSSWMTQKIYLEHRPVRCLVALLLGQRVNRIPFAVRGRHGNSWFWAGGGGC